VTWHRLWEKKMRALDLFVERQACDRSIDSRASRSLSREVNDISMRERLEQAKTLSTHDKLSLASASLALGSPFFLLGMGATFAIFDECDARRQREIMHGSGHGHKRPLNASEDMSMVKPLAASGMKEIAAGATFLSLDLSAGRFLPDRKGIGPKRRDQAVFSDRRQRANGRFLVEGSGWLKAGQLLKQKFFLMGAVEKSSGREPFSLIAGLIAQIEILDKALKRLGC